MRSFSASLHYLLIPGGQAQQPVLPLGEATLCIKDAQDSFEAGEVRHTDIARAVVRKCVFTLTDCWKEETGHAGRTHGEAPGLMRRQREAGEDGIPGQESQVVSALRLPRWC